MCECGPMLESDDVRKGFVRGVTFGVKPIEYAVVDGLAGFEGCIILGTAAEMEAVTDQIRAGADAEALDIAEAPTDVVHGVGITGQRFRWPGGSAWEGDGRPALGLGPCSSVDGLELEVGRVGRVDLVRLARQPGVPCRPRTRREIGRPVEDTL